MAPLLCVTVSAPTTAELRAARDEAARDADLVELRLDGVADLDVAGALAGRQGPVVLTCRAKWEGGSFEGSEAEREAILVRALEQGAEYVDVEFRAPFTAELVRRRGGRGIVVSAHDFGGVPPDLAEVTDAMCRTGAEIVKIAVQARRLADLLPLLHLSRAHAGAGLVIVGMGRPGLASRVLAGRFGSVWTFAGDRTDVGQVPADLMLRRYRYRDIGRSTRIFGLAGRPVAHSLSPAMHNAALQEADLDAVYLPLEAADADDFLRFAEAIGLEGASVTAPYKRDLFERADAMDALSRQVGAVNTLKRVDGRWEATNTDVPGFLAPIRGRLDLVGARAAIVGTGGAARAVAVALHSEGATVTVYGRDVERAHAAAAAVGGAARPLPPAPGTWDLLVNATPVGTFPAGEESPVEARLLQGGLVYDLVYNPPVTRFMADARLNGCETIGGLDMLVSQAERQFEWWTGVTPSSSVLRAAATAALAGTAAASRVGSAAERDGGPRGPR